MIHLKIKVLKIAIIDMTIGTKFLEYSTIVSNDCRSIFKYFDQWCYSPIWETHDVFQFRLPLIGLRPYSEVSGNSRIFHKFYSYFVNGVNTEFQKCQKIQKVKNFRNYGILKLLKLLYFGQVNFWHFCPLPKKKCYDNFTHVYGLNNFLTFSPIIIQKGQNFQKRNYFPRISVFRNFQPFKYFRTWFLLLFNMSLTFL